MAFTTRPGSTGTASGVKRREEEPPGRADAIPPVPAQGLLSQRCGRPEGGGEAVVRARTRLAPSAPLLVRAPQQDPHLSVLCCLGQKESNEGLHINAGVAHAQFSPRQSPPPRPCRPNPRSPTHIPCPDVCSSKPNLEMALRTCAMRTTGASSRPGVTPFRAAPAPRSRPGRLCIVAASQVSTRDARIGALVAASAATAAAPWHASERCRLVRPGGRRPRLIAASNCLHPFWPHCLLARSATGSGRFPSVPPLLALPPPNRNSCRGASFNHGRICLPHAGSWQWAHRTHAHPICTPRLALLGLLRLSRFRHDLLMADGARRATCAEPAARRAPSDLQLMMPPCTLVLSSPSHPQPPWHPHRSTQQPWRRHMWPP